MALRFLDGWDHYSSILQKWTGVSGAVPVFSATGTRFGDGKYLSTNGAVFYKALDNQATWIVGMAVQFAGFGTNAFLALRDAGTVQVDLRATTSGNLQVTRNGVALAISTSSMLVLNVWYFIELKATINDTTGAYEVRLNGVTVPGLSATGVDTQSTANAYANEIMISGSGIAVLVDDLYVCDGTGAKNNNFRGDKRVDTIYATADGATTDLTPSTGTDNYAMVDETPPDSDTTYNSSATVGHLDTYTYENLESAAGDVDGIQIGLFARKDDAGTRSVAPLIKTGATTAQGDDFALAASYTYNLQVFETNPANSDTDWTVSDVNSSEFGVKITA